VRVGDAAGGRDLGRGFWEKRWARALREHGDAVAQMPPNGLLTETAGPLAPGRALDAGCGHGSEALWLAGHGWQVTALDFSATVLDHCRSTAATLGPDIAQRVEWVEADLGRWAPQPLAYDFVSSLYVHVAGSVEEMVARLASGVAPGGTLLLVGHLPIDPTTGAETPAAGQVQVTLEAAAAALDPRRWTTLVAEERPRAAAGSGFDAAFCARRAG
jgi:SAM-dependent methyltransferase